MHIFMRRGRFVHLFRTKVTPALSLNNLLLQRISKEKFINSYFKNNMIMKRSFLLIAISALLGPKFGKGARSVASNRRRSLSSRFYQ
jgi:hypothetical protein